MSIIACNHPITIMDMANKANSCQNPSGPIRNLIPRKNQLGIRANTRIIIDAIVRAKKVVNLFPEINLLNDLIYFDSFIALNGMFVGILIIVLSPLLYKYITVAIFTTTSTHFII